MIMDDAPIAIRDCIAKGSAIHREM